MQTFKIEIKFFFKEDETLFYDKNLFGLNFKASFYSDFEFPKFGNAKSE